MSWIDVPSDRVGVTEWPKNPFRRLARHTPAPFDGLVEYAAGALTDAEQLVKGLPSDPIDAWDPEHIRRTLPWLQGGLPHLLPRRGRGAGEHPGGRAVAARRQPLRRAADRRHVRVLGRLLRPLRARPALPPARPRRRRQEPAAGPDPALRRRAGLARQRARRVRPRRARARLPRRRLRDVPAQLAQRPDRVRRPPGLHQARARARRPDRPGGRHRRAGDGAVRHPRRSARPS